MRRLFLLTLVGLVVLSVPATANDLTKIDRTIAKEPAYQSKPKYCLVVFGPEGQTRVWLVLDGDILYADRNGNGDLTEEGEKVSPQPVLLTGLRRPGEKEPKALRFTATVGKDGEISVMTINDNYVQVDVKDAARKIDFAASHDAQGPLKFADKPKDAPVIYCGPLTFLLPGNRVLQRGSEPGNLTVHIGRQGLGAGTSSAINIAAVPKDVHPVAEFEFPRKDQPGQTVRLKVVLDHRC